LDLNRPILIERPLMSRMHAISDISSQVYWL